MPAQAQEKKERSLPAHPPETREKAYKLFKKGNIVREISQLLKIPDGTIRVWIRHHKWRARVEAENARDAVTSVPSYIGNTSNVALSEQQNAYQERMVEQALRLPTMMATLSDRELLMAADKIGKLDATNRKALRLETTGPSTVVNVALLSGVEGKRLKAVTLPRLPTSDTLDLVPIVG